MPPAASICWKTSQAFAASWSVSDSTNQAPPAGSETLPTLDSLGGVERQAGDDLGAADGGGEGGDGAAQQVDPRVVAADHPPAGHGMLDGAAGAGRHSADLADPGPEPAQRA
jgi:hypothetical protein